MKKKKAFFTIFLTISLLSVFIYTNLISFELYKESCNYVDLSIEAKNESFQSALIYCNSALKSLGIITSKYRFSAINFLILSGIAKVGPFSFSKLKGSVLTGLQLMAWAEEDPFICALIVADDYGEKITNSETRIGLEGDILNACISAGKIEESQKIFDMMEFKNDADESEIKGVMVKALLEQNEFDKSLSIARSIDYQFLREEALFNIVSAYVEIGKIEEAIGISEMITDPFFYGRSLGEIALNCIKSYEKDKVLQMIDELCSRALSIKWGKGYWGALSLIDITSSYIQIGELERALITMNKGFEITKNIDNELFESYRLEMLDGIACAYTRSGKYEEAFNIVNSVESSDFKDVILSHIVSLNLSVERFDEAVKATNKVINISLKDLLLSQIALSYAEDLEFDKPIIIFSKISDEKLRAKIIEKLVYEYSDTGNIGKARDILEDYYKFILGNKITNETDSNIIMSTIAKSFISIKEINTALEISRELDDDSLRNEVLLEVILSLSKDNKFEKALEFVLQNDKTDFQVHSLLQIGRALQAAGIHTPDAVKGKLHEIILILAGDIVPMQASLSSIDF